MTPEQSPPATLDPDSLYAFSLAMIRESQQVQPDLSSLNTLDLLWAVTVWSAHSSEIAFRVFVAQDPSDADAAVRKFAIPLLREPTPARLFNLWQSWRTQHPQQREADALVLPVYFLLCRVNAFDGHRELARRVRSRNLPVFKTWAGLQAGPVQPDTLRQERFLDAMTSTLRATVRRQLDRSRAMSYRESMSTMEDSDSVALLGAVKREHYLRAGIVALLRIGREGPITTDSGRVIEIPTIPAVPALPVPGMEHAFGLDAGLRTIAKEHAFKELAAIAPGIQGLLETALPDAAHSAQQATRERADAKKRGGTGGRKAKKAGTAKTAVQHVSIGIPNPDEDQNEGPIGIDPESLADTRPTPQQEAEVQEESGRAMQLAMDLWGQSGERMLKALKAGQTEKAAAKAAGISGPAVTKRLNKLKKLLGH